MTLKKMPSGRRTIPKTLPYRSYSVYSISEDGIRSRVSSVAPASAHGSNNGDYLQSIVAMPKHIPIPDIPTDSDILFEVMIFFYSMIALGLQYVNLYKTVWWLPHSHVKNTVNFYLIDAHLTAFIIIILLRRIVWWIFKNLFNKFLPVPLRQMFLRVSRFVMSFVLILALFWCTYYILIHHPLLHILYLYYPITLVYVSFFGTNLTPLFELFPMQIKIADKNRPNSNEHNQNQAQIKHTCYLTAEAVREEVEQLRVNFNERLKSCIFNSVVSAYYSSLMPFCFVPTVLLFDKSWVLMHSCFTGFSYFVLYLLHAYPPYYCDILHRSALHLGRWQKLESRNLHIPYLPWSDSSMWHQGALVKQTKDLFRAEGLINAAEPGNVSHSRFYAFFINPSNCLCCLLAVQLTIVIVEIILLFRSYEWNRIISTSLLLFCNYYTLFKLFRDYSVLWKIYRAEQLIQDQMTN